MNQCHQQCSGNSLAGNIADNYCGASTANAKHITVIASDIPCGNAVRRKVDSANRFASCRKHVGLHAARKIELSFNLLTAHVAIEAHGNEHQRTHQRKRRRYSDDEIAQEEIERSRNVVDVDRHLRSGWRAILPSLSISPWPFSPR